MLVFAVDLDETKPLGTWGADAMPDGCQVHPQCSYAATHDSFHNLGATQNALPWIVPMDLAPEQVVKFKVTVVRDYETWFAFEMTFTVGSVAGGGEAGLALATTRSGAPGSGGVHKPGVRAPGMGAAVEGGWRAPDATKSPTMDSATPGVSSSDAGEVPTISVDGSSGGGGGGRGGGGGSGGGGGRKAEAGGGKIIGGVEGGGDTFMSVALAKAKRRTARIVHGFVMGLVWLVLAPGAALVSRHGRKAPWWFAFHRNAGITVAVATLGAAAFITAVRGWSTPWGRHGKVGAAVCVLVLVQSAGGVLRKSLPRATWSAVHRVTGAALLVAAAYNCLLGAAMIGRMETGTKRAYSLVCAATATCAMLGGMMELQRRRHNTHAKLERKL